MKIEITCITPVLQAILDFFPDIISFQHVFHLGVGRSQIEWKLKAKTQISVFQWAKIGQNDHSNPYIESTTVLSDRMFYLCVITCCVNIRLRVHLVRRGRGRRVGGRGWVASGCDGSIRVQLSVGWRMRVFESSHSLFQQKVYG